MSIYELERPESVTGIGVQLTGSDSAAVRVRPFAVDSTFSAGRVRPCVVRAACTV